MSSTVVLSDTGKTYTIPSKGEVSWPSLSNYLHDLAGAVNNAGGGVAPSSMLDIKSYGAKGDGTTDDTAAVQAWVNAVAGGALVGAGGYAGKGDYKITSTITIPSTAGALFSGCGRSANFVWAGPPGGKVFDIKPGYFNTFRNFRITLPDPSASRVPNYVMFMANPGPPNQPYAISGHVFQSINIEGSRGSAAHGIYWEDTYGNASEITYLACTIVGCDISVMLPGTQQKSHTFLACQFGQGNIGVRCGGGIANSGAGGSFVWYGGGVGTMAYSAFTAEYPNDPIEIRGCQSEHCARFFDTIPSGSPANPTQGVQSVSITGCRLDTANNGGLGITAQYNSYMRFYASGPYEVRGCNFNADSPLRIMIGTATTALTIEDNTFTSAGAISVSPLNFDDTPGATRWSDVSMRGNRFMSADAVVPYQQRLEALDTYVLVGGDDISRPSLVAQNKNRYLLALPPATAAATTQSILVTNLPRGVRIKPIGVLVYSRYQMSGAPDISVSIGTSSGGQELFLSQKVSTADGVRLGLTPGEWGSAMRAEGCVPDYFNAVPLYVNWKSSSGNLGNGSTSNFTAGTGFILLEAEQDARWLHNI